MGRKHLRTLLAAAFLVLCLSLSGVLALWQYAAPAADAAQELPFQLGRFRYGMLYITDISVGGSYESARVNKTGDATADADLRLLEDGASEVTAQVTFYNSTDISYYYDETLVSVHSGGSIGLTVTGIHQKDEVPAGTYKTITVTFHYLEPADPSNRDYAASLDFRFSIDRDSIGEIVAKTAVEKFEEVLNNLVVEDSCQQLTDAMDNRGGWNKSSAVTYIGNVAGADSGDSAVIQELFGQELMSMDLDGDGNVEPITIMIKREDLDDNATTGGSYTYTEWNRDTTVNGCEMTLYITAEDFTGLNRGDTVTVYAVTYTKLPGAAQWTQVVPLTKGTASANSYSGGWGSADSFNTDTWRSDSNETMQTLVRNAASFQ